MRYQLKVILMIPEVPQPASERWRTIRRAKRTFAATTVATGLLLGPSAPPSEQRPHITWAQQQEANVRRISHELTAFEDRMGDQKLTFTQAAEFTPLIVEQFKTFSHSSRNAEDIPQDIYIISGNFESREERNEWLEKLDSTDVEIEAIKQHRIIQQLLADYPDRTFTDEKLYEIMWNMTDPAAGWIGKDNNIYLALDTINNIDSPYGQELAQKVILYDTIGAPLLCKPVTPAALYRTVAVHELEHYDSKDTTLPSPLIQEIYQEEENMDPFVPDDEKKQYTYAATQGFAVVTYHTERGESTVEQRGYRGFFDEIVVDYLTAKTNMRFGKPFTIAYGNPVDFKNLEQLLLYSGISDEELNTMHQASQFEELLVRLAGAATNISFQSRKDMVTFGLNLLDTPKGAKIMGSGEYIIVLDWDEISKYYPGVDVGNYAFSLNPDDVEDGELAGCIH